jgi:hypothetical protein
MDQTLKLPASNVRECFRTGTSASSVEAVQGIFHARKISIFVVRFGQVFGLTHMRSANPGSKLRERAASCGKGQQAAGNALAIQVQ